MQTIQQTLATQTRPGKFQTMLSVDTASGPLAIPVNVVNGSQLGTTSLLLAGVHGDEFDGPEAIRRWWHASRPEQLSGRVILIPALNLPAYLAASRRNPEDDVDMSSAWRSDAPDSTTVRIARQVQEQILPHVDQLLDMHGGGDIFNIHRLVMYQDLADTALLERTLHFAKNSGIALMWRFPPSQGLNGYMASLGKVGIGVEIGGEARLREDAVHDNLQAIHNFLVTAGNQSGTVALPRQWKVIEGRPDHSENAGFLQSFVQLGEQVSEGQRLGLISDVAGNTHEEVLAPHDGIVTTIRTKPILPAGGATFQVSTVALSINNDSFEEQA
jgi:predicted deacylase